MALNDGSQRWWCVGCHVKCLLSGFENGQRHSIGSDHLQLLGTLTAKLH